ncbi:MAG: PQQ-dependent sugar dehydrogenase, partial [Chloroflexia bacterium]|nr:PQQ-dependent sugar dehydrogenase [Chloroflexia bacterium]
LHVVHGILLHEGRVYLAGEHEVWVADVLDDGTFGEPEAIVDDLPDGAQHGRRTIGIGPDDMLYISIGSSCNACAETDLEHATILRTSLDGGEREIFASGPRNTLGFGWHPETGELWGMDHGSDGRGDDQPPEELHRLVEGGNYGWPYCFGDQAVDRFLSRTPVGATPEQYCANTVAPVLTYQAHSAPIAMVFYEGDQFPDELQGDALVAMRGSWNRSLPTGFKVVHIDFEDGTPVAIDGFVTGWLVDDGAAQFGRIAGLTVTDNGALLVSDDTNGVIYRIAYTD